MTKSNNEFKEAIKEKEAEISAIDKELKEAADDPGKIVLAEKKKRRALAELETLQAAQRIAEYRPAEPTDRQELLKVLDKYTDSHKARIDKINDDIAKLDRENAEIEMSLKEAAEKVDTETTIQLSNRRDEIKDIKKYLLQMLETAKSLPLYPDDALSDEWAEICKRLKPEWDNKIMALKTIASAYRAAASSLIEMNNTLLSVRKTIEAQQDGLCFPSYFSVGETADEMTIDKVYMAQISNIFTNVIYGRTL
ncbi:MAG: hypothetical protein K5894_09925 [Lachnospiraceae bacterium]|nr:hypothetical protein [Lachnospiraceae bacterium]